MASAARSPLGVVLLRLRIAEEGHQPVAELLQHMAAQPGYRPRSFVEIGVDQVAPVLGVELRGEARRADKIAEHHGDRAALSGDFRDPCRAWAGGRPRGNRRFWTRCRRCRRSQLRNRVEQLSPMPYACDSKFFQVLACEARKDIGVHRVVA